MHRCRSRLPGPSLHGVARILCFLFCILIYAGPARAQAVKGSILSVGIGGNGGKDGVYREGSWIPVQVLVKNMTPAPIAAHLGVTQLDLDGDKVLSVGPEFILEPGVEGRKVWTYYWPRTDMSTFQGGITEIAVYDANGPISKITINSAPPGSLGYAEAVNPDSDTWKKSETAKRSARFVVVLGDSLSGWRNFDGMWGGTEAVKSVLVKPDQLPDDVRGFDGVDTLVWEADSVKVSDIPADFQLKAMLEWVRAGGHLIISVASQGQEFLKAPALLQSAMPLSLTGASRDLKPTDVSGYHGGYVWRFPAVDRLVTQSIGDMKADSRPVLGLFSGVLVDHPLAVTGTFGRGAVTVVTIDVANPEFRMPDDQWIVFWNQIAGWQSTKFFTADQYKKDAAQPERDREIIPNSREIQIGASLPGDIDVKDVTSVRILVALLFLAVYWLLAGPVGHLVLRYYRVVHWSWWIFGATVLAATAVAGTVVLALHVNAYDLRHRSFVLGSVNSPDVTVAGFYGVYAPVSGPVKIAQPLPFPGAMNYLAPMCVPTFSQVKSFADPQGYELPVSPLKDSQETALWPIFRNTLKKMQGRWTGQLGKIEGNARFLSESTDIRHLVTGSLTNNSGYDLAAADVLIYLPRATPQEAGSTYLFHVGTDNNRKWPQGKKLDLEPDLQFDALEPQNIRLPGTVETALEAMATKMVPQSNYGYNPMGTHYTDDQLTKLERRDWAWESDFLYFLLDARRVDALSDPHRAEPLRGFGRLTDVTKLLHASCGLIIAYANDVKSPVPISINDKIVPGKGKILFAWSLPISGKAPSASLIPDPSASGPTPVRGTPGNPLLPENP